MASGLSGAGVALGTAIGGGVVAIVSKISEVVVDFVKETIAGSEELTAAWGELTGTFSELVGSITGTSGTVKEQLSEMFAPIIKGVLEFVTTYVQSFKALVEQAKPYIDASKEAITGIVEGAQPYFDAFLSGVQAVMSNVGYAIQAGVENFSRIKEAVLNMTAPVIAALQTIPGYISAAFGSTQVQTLVSWGEAIKANVTDALELAGLFIRNWPDFLDIAATEINQTINDIGAYFNTIPENAQIVGMYLAQNWKALVVDAISAVGRAFVNLGDNIGKLAFAIQDFFAGKGWHFDPTDLMEGFKATADKLPELAKPKFQDVSSQAIKEINEKIAQQELNRKPFKLELTEKKKTAEDVAAKQAEAGAAFKSQTMGSADFASKLRESILSKDKDDVPKQQLKTQERIAKAAEDTAEAVKKPKPATLG